MVTADVWPKQPYSALLFACNLDTWALVVYADLGACILRVPPSVAGRE